jgi:uncharacterized membrane protein YgdD (TMEM256/DUF423 family)
MNSFFVKIGSILFVVAIILGAFGAHALKNSIPQEAIKSFEVGVRYQFYQALAFLVIGFSADKLTFNLRLFSIGMLTGIILFSGSIYVLALKEALPISVSIFGPITPLGGLVLILSWIGFIYKLIRTSKAKTPN